MATLRELYMQGHKDVCRNTTGKTVNLSLDISYKHTLSAFDAICDDWEPVIEKKKKVVTLFRNTVKGAGETVYQTNWSTNNYMGSDVVKQESKEVEYEE